MFISAAQPLEHAPELMICVLIMFNITSIAPDSLALIALTPDLF